jgi:hypothetical protein
MRASRLYFYLPGSSAELLAEDHCYWQYMPSLWKVLIANGTPLGDLAPLSGERALPTQTIAAPAHEAIARLEFLTELIQFHPLRHQLPNLPVLLDGVRSFLDERLACFPAQQRDRIMVAAQLGTNAHDEDSAEVNARLCNDWLLIEATGADGQFHDLEDALGFARGRRGITEWEAWTNGFGLSTLAHPYFERLEIVPYSDEEHNAPATRSYQSYQARHFPQQAKASQRARPRESKLKSAWLIFCGLLVYAFRRARGASHDSALERHDDGGAPDENDLNEADYRDLAEKWRYTGMFPDFVDGKVGLCAVEEHGDELTRGASIVAPDWDEIDFPKAGSVWGRRGGTWTLIGLDDLASTVVAEVCCDEVVEYDHDGGICIARIGQQVGMVSAYERRWAAPAIYDEIKCDEYNSGYWRVRRGALWGVLDDSGQVRHACEFDSIEPDIREYPYTELGWRVERAGRVGWIDRACEWQVDCVWDEIRPSMAKGLFAVARQSRWGIVASGNRAWIPADYVSAEPVAMGPLAGPPQEDPLFLDDTIWPDEPVPAFVAAHDQSQALLLVVVGTEHGMGVVDQANRIVVPCVYRDIAVARTHALQDSRWLCIVDQNGRHGLWDIMAGAEILRCAHDWLEVIVAPLLQPMAATFDDGRYRLWHLDGSPAFAGAFRWVSSERRFEADVVLDRDESRYRTGQIAEEWSEGKEVRAAMIIDGEADRIVLLKPGQPVRDEYAALAQAYQQDGDISAAFQLAAQYRYGDGVARDDVLARLWAGRACGHEPRPATPAPADSDAQIDACLLFSELLYEGLGGPREPALARHWAEQAVAHQGKHSDRLAPIALAKTLLDPQAGPVDHVRAHELLEPAEGKALNDYDACYYRAVIHRDGLGVRQDWTKARDLLGEADDGGYEPAARALADLLKKMAIVAPKAQARQLMQEADYYATKASAFDGT